MPCGNLSSECEVDASRRSSFLRMVSLGKLKRESMSDKASQETEEEPEEEELAVKTREPLSGNTQVNTTLKKIKIKKDTQLIEQYVLHERNLLDLGNIAPP